MNISKLTTKQIKAYQKAIIKAILNNESAKRKLQAEYTKLSIELHIRTKGITYLKPYKKRKYCINKRKKLIKQILKDITCLELKNRVKRLLEEDKI